MYPMILNHLRTDWQESTTAYMKGKKAYVSTLPSLVGPTTLYRNEVPAVGAATAPDSAANTV